MSLSAAKRGEKEEEDEDALLLLRRRKWTMEVCQRTLIDYLAAATADAATIHPAVVH